MLEVIASNLLGCLTPLGNPQNLFVFARSHVSVLTFVIWMLPFCLMSLALIAVALVVLIPNQELQVESPWFPAINSLQAAAGTLCFAAVLMLVLRIAGPWPVFMGVGLIGVFILRWRILRIDFTIIPLFIAAFVIVEGLQSLNLYRLAGPLHLSQSRGAFFLAGCVTSQFLSNVPATILLAPLAALRWKLLLYSVNAAGCGTIIASLANLLGWQIFRRESPSAEPFLGRFFILNLVFLFLIGSGAWLLVLAT